MSLIVVGLNHHTVPVGLLERMSVPAVSLPKALHDLSSREHLAEVALLSTCNRTEVYAHCTRFHAAVQDVREFLAAHSGADPDSFGDLLYTYYDDAAVAHLFGVAAGVDSMIIGEGEILGQVREAWRAAEYEGTIGAYLGRAGRHAVEVGRRSRTETEIGRHAVSIASAAVSLAAERLGSLSGRSVLVLGAGEVGAGLAVALAGAGVGEVVVSNRTPDRAEALAERIGGRAAPFSEVPALLERADVLLTSTASQAIVVERHDIEAVVVRRPDRPLLVVDVAVPRDVDAGVAEIPGVTLLDIDDLKTFAERSMSLRSAEVAKVRRIIVDELDRWRSEHAARSVAPLVTALRARAEDLRLVELERHRVRLEGLGPAARDAIEAVTRSFVNKLLHDPTVRVKDAAGTARGALLADALAELFDLGDTGDDAAPPGASPADERPR